MFDHFSHSFTLSLTPTPYTHNTFMIVVPGYPWGISSRIPLLPDSGYQNLYILNR